MKYNEFDVLEGDDLARVLGIKEIYFDFNEWDIRPDAEIELQKVLVVLAKYPHLKIEIRSHTDSRGKDSYNMTLSEKRAKSTMQYLMDKGISKNRLTAKGYGESRLLNECTNGVRCMEEQHLQNRRSEFLVSSDR